MLGSLVAASGRRRLINQISRSFNSRRAQVAAEEINHLDEFVCRQRVPAHNTNQFRPILPHFADRRTRIDPTDKTLTLEHLSVADSAAYVCEGENSVGSAKSVATVSVQCK